MLNKTKLIKHPLGVFFLLQFFLWPIFHAHSQSIPEDFKDQTKVLTKTKPKTYLKLETELKKVRWDTTLMRYFTNQSRQENYLEGMAFGLNQIGTRYRNTSQYKKAADLHQEA